MTIDLQRVLFHMSWVQIPLSPNMGYSQAVRHRNLDPTCKGSNPFTPGADLYRCRAVTAPTLCTTKIHRGDVKWCSCNLTKDNTLPFFFLLVACSSRVSFLSAKACTIWNALQQCLKTNSLGSSVG